MRLALSAGLLALAIAVLAGCTGPGDGGAVPVKPPATGTGGPVGGVQFRFEQFTSAPLVDGGEVTLESLRGRVAVLDLFGTWRPACRRTAPLLVSLYERFHSQGLQIVGLAYERMTDPTQQRDAVRAFRQEFSIPYPLALGPASAWADLAAKAGVTDPSPTLVVLDREGAVRAVFVGLKPGQEAVLADRVERLLAEPASH
jgi:thiol-disulfide isomerase/thioredoxin